MTTKIELAQANTRLAEENAALRTQLAEALASIEALKAQKPAAKKSVYQKPAIELAWETALAAARAHAKEVAQREGRSVAVTLKRSEWEAEYRAAH